MGEQIGSKEEGYLMGLARSETLNDFMKKQDDKIEEEYKDHIKRILDNRDKANQMSGVGDINNDIKPEEIKPYAKAVKLIRSTSTPENSETDTAGKAPGNENDKIAERVAKQHTDWRILESK